MLAEIWQKVAGLTDEETAVSEIMLAYSLASNGFITSEDSDYQVAFIVGGALVRLGVPLDVIQSAGCRVDDILDQLVKEATTL